MSYAEENRYLRYRDLLPMEKIQSFTHAVIGVGAIGRQVALQLASMGARYLTLIDHDLVDDVNLGPQGYFPEDLGERKVLATANTCRRIADIPITQFPRRWDDSLGTDTPQTIVYLCVDSMAARKFIVEGHTEAPLIIDARMAAESWDRYVIDSPGSRAAWLSEWYDDNAASPQRCTAKSTIYCANGAAASMVAAMTAWVRERPVPHHRTYAL